jgi:hypothetical protein
MQKIGVKRTKRNNAVRKEKLKRQKLAKKLEDDDPDYVPNIFDAADSEDEGDVSNQKPPPKTIAVLGKEMVPHPSVTVTDGMQNCDGMQNSNTVSDGMQNIAPIVHNNLVPLSTDSFFAIYYSPKNGGIG